jgi:sodium transport system permease protein
METSHPPTPGALTGPRLPSPRSVLLLLAAVVGLYFVVGIPLQLLFGEVGLALTQLTVFLGATLVFIRRGGYDVARTLSLRLPSAGQVGGGLLLLAGGTPVAWLLAWFQSRFIPVPVELLESMGEFLRTDDPLRIAWLLVLIAVIPAVCEEFLFRGAILAGLRTRFTVVAAVALNGLLFGLLHAPQAIFRFLPTAWLGIVLAWAVWESRSIWIGVLLHFVNNGAILLLTVLPATRDAAADVDRHPPLLLLPVALVLMALGASVLVRARPATGPLDPPSRDDRRP